MSEFTREEWFKLPLKLRQRWWRETGYGANPPSDELAVVLNAAMAINEALATAKGGES